MNRTAVRRSILITSVYLQMEKLQNSALLRR